jgi:hypothetical protein
MYYRRVSRDSDQRDAAAECLVVKEGCGVGTWLFN